MHSIASEVEASRPHRMQSASCASWQYELSWNFLSSRCRSQLPLMSIIKKPKVLRQIGLKNSVDPNQTAFGCITISEI